MATHWSFCLAFRNHLSVQKYNWLFALWMLLIYEFFAVFFYKPLVCHGRSKKMKEMVGGCCVCSDERGWPDNPLVYCDGTSCTVAVHQGDYNTCNPPSLGLRLLLSKVWNVPFLCILLFNYIIIVQCSYFPMYTSWCYLSYFFSLSFASYGDRKCIFSWSIFAIC